MINRSIAKAAALVSGALGAMLFSGTVSADPAAEFYKGKTVRVIIGASAGGGYDFYGRLFARHIGKYIPGNPTVVAVNMTGAGQYRAARYVYTAAPKDGTTLLEVVQTVAIDTALGTQSGVNAADYEWIGRLTSNVAVGTVWQTADAKTAADLRNTETIFAGTGRGDMTAVVPQMLNEYAGAKIRVINGYAGAAEMSLAMEKGEVQGHVGSWTALKTRRVDLLRENKVNILFQVALRRHRDLQDVPTITELAQSEDGKQALRFISSSAEIGRSIVGPPGMPKERVLILRRAFDKMTTDPELLDDVRKRKVDFDPMTGEEMEKVVADAANTPEHIISATREAVGVK